MTPDTLTEMILGFAVMIGVLLIYILSLFIRIRKTTAKLNQRRQE